MKTPYQGIRLVTDTKNVSNSNANSVINYPGVRSKGFSTKTVRKMFNGKVFSVLSWNANISEEQLRIERK